MEVIGNPPQEQEEQAEPIMILDVEQEELGELNSDKYDQSLINKIS